jgi:hypothetical protein
MMQKRALSCWLVGFMGVGRLLWIRSMLFGCDIFPHAMWDCYAIWHWKQEHFFHFVFSPVLALEKRSISMLPWGLALSCFNVQVLKTSLFGHALQMEFFTLIRVYLPPLRLPISTIVMRNKIFPRSSLCFLVSSELAHLPSWHPLPPPTCLYNASRGRRSRWPALLLLPISPSVWSTFSSRCPTHCAIWSGHSLSTRTTKLPRDKYSDVVHHFGVAPLIAMSCLTAWRCL